MNFAQNITHAIFFFPGTFLHELLHLLAAIIAMTIGMFFNLLAKPFGIGPISYIKITSFNVLPNFKTGVYGSVKYEGGSSLALIFISAAPKLAWLFLFYYLQDLSVLHLRDTELTGEQNITIRWGHLSAPELMLGFYAGMQLLWAGSLSRQDWHNIFSAFGKILSILIAIFAIGYMLYSITSIQEIFVAIWHAFTSPLSLAASLFSSGNN